MLTKQQAGLWRSAGRWGALGLLLLVVLLGYSPKSVGAGWDETSPGPGPCVQPPGGLVAWWPLDETSGTTAHDVAGMPNNGTYVNGPTPTSGKVDGAFHFDGVDDYVHVPNHAELNVAAGSFTVDTWVRTNWLGNGVVVIQDKRDLKAGYHLHLYRNPLYTQGKAVPALNITYTPGSPPFENHNAVNAPNIADGQWHHIAAVANVGSKMVLIYVDGKLVYSQPSMILGGKNLNNGSDFYIGRREPSLGPGPGYFPGDLDEVELFRRALSQQEVGEIYNAGAAGKCKKRGLI